MVLVASLSCCAAASLADEGAPAPDPVVFDIAAGPLETVLLELARQTGCDLVSASGTLAGKTAAALRGELTLQQALQRILQGSGLNFQITPSCAVIIQAELPVTKPATVAPTAEKAVEELLVYGMRQSLRAALQQKREAPALVDAISAEGIGKFPDANVAEALQRVTGVSITRTIGGEGQYAAVRGLGQQCNAVLFNGRVLPTDDSGRDFSFDILPSTLVANATVYKSPLATLSEGGIGGTIDLRSARPLDRQGDHVSVAIATLYDDNANRAGPHLAAFFNRVNAENTLGAALDVTYAKRHWRADLAQSINRGQLGYDANGDGDIDTASEIFEFPGIWSYAHKYGERERLGLTMALQAQPHENLEAVLDLLYCDYKTPEVATYQNTNFWNASDRLQDVRIEDDAITEFRAANLPYEFAIDPKNRQVETLQYGWLTRWQASDELQLTLDASTALTRRPEGGEQRFWVAGIPGADFHYRARPRIADLEVSLPPLVDGAPRRDVSDYWNDEIAVHFMESKGEDIRDRIDALRVEAAWQLNSAVAIQLGSAWSAREKNKTAYAAADACAYCGFPFRFGDVGLLGLRDFPTDDFFAGESGQFPRHWPTLDANALLEIVRAAEGRVINPATGDFYPQGYADRVLPQAQPRASSRVRETLRAVYAQMDFEFLPWRGNAGLRWVETRVRAEGFAEELLSFTPIPGTSNFSPEFGQLTPVTEANRYQDWLPSANLVYQFLDDWHIRLAAAKVISRPSLSSLGPDVNWEFNSGTPYLVRNGNTQLQAIHAKQADIALEWYASPELAASLALFYKDVDGFVGTATVTEHIAGQDYIVGYPVNRHRAEIYGFELAYQQLFANGFGWQINYTRAEKQTPQNQSANALPGLSKHGYNLVGLYERDEWRARLAYNFRDAYIATAIGQASDPETTDSFATLDARISCEFLPDWQWYVDGQNLTREAHFTYSVKPNRPLNYEQLGRRIAVGLRLKF